MGQQTSLLPERLAELRKENGWTLADLAEKLEVTRQTCGNYESGSRRPDADIIVQICKRLNVSADYLLGLSNTRKPEYADISQTTGLSQGSIEYLKHTMYQRKVLVNHLLEEEPSLPPWFFDTPEIIADERFDDPEYLEQQYQQHLEHLAWEQRMKQTSILEHIANDWALQDHFANQTEDEIMQAALADQERMRKRYENVDPEQFGPIDYDEERAEKQRQAIYDFEAGEAQKSRLLSAIAEYVAYTSGCTIETSMRSEALTNLHAINIGTGNGNAITFPSAKGDELLEFMLLQKVIDTLRAFKKNCYSLKDK